MKRAKNRVDAKINYISPKNEILMFKFSKLKVLKNGENHVGPWNFYAKLHKTNLCAHKSLTRYIFTYTQLLVEDSPLFEGKNNYGRYAQFFMKLVKDNIGELKTMRVVEGGIDTYSCSKGVAKMVA